MGSPPIDSKFNGSNTHTHGQLPTQDDRTVSTVKPSKEETGGDRERRFHVNLTVIVALVATIILAWSLFEAYQTPLRRRLPCTWQQEKYCCGCFPDCGWCC